MNMIKQISMRTNKNQNRKNRDESYYASSRRDMHSIGNGRTYHGPQDSDIYESEYTNYDDGYDSNYPSPAYSMGSGNFNMGRKVNRDAGNMFKPDYYDWEDDSFRDREMQYDRNYSDDFHELDDDDDLYGQPIGRYNRHYFDTRNRENRLVPIGRRPKETNKEKLRKSTTAKMGKNSRSRPDNEEGASGTDWYGYYNRAFNGANSSNYENRSRRNSSNERYAGTLRRKRPYL
jgi:hypothetical protein